MGGERRLVETWRRRLAGEDLRGCDHIQTCTHTHIKLSLLGLGEPIPLLLQNITNFSHSIYIMIIIRVFNKLSLSYDD